MLLQLRAAREVHPDGRSAMRTQGQIFVMGGAPYIKDRRPHTPRSRYSSLSKPSIQRSSKRVISLLSSDLICVLANKPLSGFCAGQGVSEELSSRSPAQQNACCPSVRGGSVDCKPGQLRPWQLAAEADERFLIRCRSLNSEQPLVFFPGPLSMASAEDLFFVSD